MKPPQDFLGLRHTFMQANLNRPKLPQRLKIEGHVPEVLTGDGLEIDLLDAVNGVFDVFRGVHESEAEVIAFTLGPNHLKEVRFIQGIQGKELDEGIQGPVGEIQMDVEGAARRQRGLESGSLLEPFKLRYDLLLNLPDVARATKNKLYAIPPQRGITVRGKGLAELRVPHSLGSEALKLQFQSYVPVLAIEGRGCVVGHHVSELVLCQCRLGEHVSLPL